MNCTDCNWSTGHSSNCKYGKGRYQYDHGDDAYRNYNNNVVRSSSSGKDITYSVVRKSKFNSSCVICESKVSIGESIALIMWESRKKWVHNKCKILIGID
jgi:hypothetical protein